MGVKDAKVISIDGKLAEKYRLMQAQELIDCFTEDQGRAPKNNEEIEAWFAKNKHKVPLDAKGHIVPRHPKGA